MIIKKWIFINYYKRNMNWKKIWISCKNKDHLINQRNEYRKVTYFKLKFKKVNYFKQGDWKVKSDCC